MTSKQKLENLDKIKKFLDSPVNTNFMYRFDDPFNFGRSTTFVNVIGENGNIFVEDWGDNSKVFVVKESRVTPSTLHLYLNKTIMEMCIDKIERLTIYK